MTDEIAERVLKIRVTTLRSIGHIAPIQRADDNDTDYVPPVDMLRELLEGNKALLRCVQCSWNCAFA
jgi:starvation-inducible DNA-binding protein